MNEFLKKIFRNFFLVLFLGCIVYSSAAYAEVPVNSQSYLESKKLGDLSCVKEDFAKAAYYYAQALEINPNEADLNKLGLIYYMNDDYQNSIKSFEKSLCFNPNNKRTKAKIEYVNYLISEKEKNDKVNSMEPKLKAPRNLHRMVQVKSKLENAEDEEKLHKIIDFLWSDEEGRVLLKKVLNSQTPIYLKRKIKHSYFTASQVLPLNEGVLSNPLSSQLLAYSNYIEKQIYIKESDISNFQKKGNTYKDNEWAITVLAHEICHMTNFMSNPRTKDSKEEELIATVIGYNIASRILNDKPLSEEQVKEKAISYYNSTILRHGCPYRDLPMNENFARSLVPLGVNLPYYGVYANLNNLKLPDQFYNPAIQCYIKNLNVNLSENFDFVSQNRSHICFYNIYIDKENKISRASMAATKLYKYREKEDLFNINTAMLLSPFPQNYQGIFIPVIIYSNKNIMKARYLVQKK